MTCIVDIAEDGTVMLGEAEGQFEEEVARLRAALLDIVDPMKALEREATTKGEEFIWKVALLRASDPEFFKGIARKALAG